MCAWCDNPSTEWEPMDDIEASNNLCRDHVAEYHGLSVDGLERMEGAERADLANLGYFD